MASDLETRAKEAFIDDHFDLAVDLYSQAISLSPKNPDLYSDRAQANIKLKSFTEAVSDANRAIGLDPSMSKAYLRKGTACFSLEEFQTAKAAFESGASLSPEDKRFTNWIDKCDKAIAEEAATFESRASLAPEDLRFAKWIEKCDKFMAEAVSDANQAIELDPSMSKAYPRKGTACFRPKEFQTAKTAFESGASLAPEDKRFINWIEKCDKAIAEEAATFESGASLATEDKRFTNWIEKCDMAIAEKAGELTRHSSDIAPTASQLLEKADATPKDSPPFSDISGAVTTVSPAKPKYRTTVSPAKPKYRHEFFQKPEEVVVTIFAKGIPAKCVAVDFGEQILSVTIEKPGEDAYNFQPRLFGKIVPAKCKYEVLSTKIEIRLAKAEAIQWTSLEFSRDNLVVQKINASSAFQRPTYPSSKSKTDWDKLEAEVKKEEKDEKLDGDAALNKFFREIYSDADEDTRRAMRKSFVESNGTVLSTNWKEVGAKKVEGTPPDGMELKKWEI